MNKIKRFFILGVTGSIGRQAIEVLRTLNNYIALDDNNLIISKEN